MYPRGCGSKGLRPSRAGWGGRCQVPTLQFTVRFTTVACTQAVITPTDIMRVLAGVY